MPSDERILVVAQHGRVAQLLTEFCAAAGREALCPAAGEPPTAACARVHPRLLILDFELPMALRDACRAWMSGAESRLLLFSGCCRHSDLRSHAEREGLPFFTLPIAWREFVPVLDAALAG
jgi:DNA-binding response OmpR family regulator